MSLLMITFYSYPWSRTNDQPIKKNFKKPHCFILFRKEMWNPVISPLLNISWYILFSIHLFFSKAFRLFVSGVSARVSYLSHLCCWSDNSTDGPQKCLMTFCTIQNHILTEIISLWILQSLGEIKATSSKLIIWGGKRINT